MEYFGRLGGENYLRGYRFHRIQVSAIHDNMFLSLFDYSEANDYTSHVLLLEVGHDLYNNWLYSERKPQERLEDHYYGEKILGFDDEFILWDNFLRLIYQNTPFIEQRYLSGRVSEKVFKYFSGGHGIELYILEFVQSMRGIVYIDGGELKRNATNEIIERCNCSVIVFTHIGDTRDIKYTDHIKLKFPDVNMDGATVAGLDIYLSDPLNTVIVDPRDRRDEILRRSVQRRI